MVALKSFAFEPGIPDCPILLPDFSSRLRAFFITSPKQDTTQEARVKFQESDDAQLALHLTGTQLGDRAIMIVLRQESSSKPPKESSSTVTTEEKRRRSRSRSRSRGIYRNISLNSSL